MIETMKTMNGWICWILSFRYRECGSSFDSTVFSYALSIKSRLIEKNLPRNVGASGWVDGWVGQPLGPNYELNDRVVTVKNDPLEWRQ